MADFFMYEAYKRFCDRTIIDGVVLYSNLNEQEIKQWEESTNKLQWLEK